MQGNTGRTSQKADSVAVAELRRQARELCDLVRANRIGEFVTLLAKDREDIEGLAAGLTGAEAERLRAIDREFLLEAARDKNESARSYMHFLLSSTCPWGARCRPIDAGTAKHLFAEAVCNGNVQATKALLEHKDVGPLIDIGLEANGLMHCLAQSLGHAGHLQVLEYLVRESPLRGRFASGFLPELLEAARGGRLLDPLAWTALAERFEIRDAARLPAPARQETRVLGPKEETREKIKEEPMKKTKETPPAPAGRNAWKSDRKKGEEFELAGRAELARRLNDEVVDLALHPEAYKPFGIKAPASMLFYGEPGCGKTYAVNRLVEFLGWKRVEITASDVYCSEAHQSNIRKRFREAFIAAERGERAVVVMDELDTFLIRRDEVGRNPWVVEEVNEFLTCIQEAHDRGVMVIGMCNSLARLDPAALRPGRFDMLVEVEMPGREEIEALLGMALSSAPGGGELDLEPLVEALVGKSLADVVCVVDMALRPGRFDLHIGVDKPTREEARELLELGLAGFPLEPGLDLEPALNALSGKSVAEVTLLRNRALRLAAERDKECLDRDCLEAALEEFRDHCRRSALARNRRRAPRIERKEGQCDAPFSLPGRRELSRRLNEEVVEPTLRPEQYGRFDLKTPPSILLHGEPGCGKTYAVDKLVEHLGWPCVRIEASDVFSKLAHDNAIRERFEEAFVEAAAGGHAVVVMDELDSFLSKRDNAGNNPWVLEEVNEFLTCLQEAHDKGVLVIGMCNEPERLDPAALRPGRFDLHIGVGKPTREEARELIEAGLAKCPLDPGLDLEPILDELSGKSVADVTLLLNRARRLAAEQDKEALDQDCLEGALKSCRADRAATRKYLGPIGF